MRIIPFSPPDISKNEISAVDKTLASGWITTGSKTKEFENRISEFIGTDKAVALNSCTSALELTLRILGIGRGDEVITTCYTYTASASVIEHVGAKIVFADNAKGSFEMDYKKLPDLITEKTKAIIAVDIAGKMCNYDEIYKAIVSQKSLFKPQNELQEIFNRIIVIADSAHSFGARRNSISSGLAADFTVFSFHAVKNITTAEGGCVVWKSRSNLDNDELYNKYMLYSLHGQSKDAYNKTIIGQWEYDIIHTGYKCNMTDVLASIGLEQLKRFDKLISRRREIVKRYDVSMKEMGISFLNHMEENCFSTCHLYLIRIDGYDEERRNRFVQRLAEKGVAVNVHYKPLPMMTAYKNLGFDISLFPNAYNMYCNEVTLPLHTLLTDNDVDYVIKSVKESLAD